MKKISLKDLYVGITTIFLFINSANGQGDNSPDPMINLAALEGAVVTGNAPEGGRGIPSDIIWDPSKYDYVTPSEYNEYGMAYDDIMLATEDDPLYWQVVWETPKYVTYITCSGVYDNQPQPTTGWAVQILVDDEWRDLAKAHNGWAADTLRGAGYGKPTQTNWLWDGQLVWRGLEPIVTRGIRFTAYANPDSLADGKESFADSLWSFAWSGRSFGPETAKSALIQHLDFSEEAADNKLDLMVNLALLDEAVVSADFQEWDFTDERNQPIDVLYDPVKDDYHNKNTFWGEFGYAYDYEAGYPEGPDDGFQYIIEWPVPKKINYFTWGGTWSSQHQPDTPWALQYWDGETWQILIDGIGGGLGWDASNGEPDGTPWPYAPGVDVSALSIWMIPTSEAIETTKIRLAAWSNGIWPLWSFHIRCRGGACITAYDDSNNPFKAVLVQYAEIIDPTTIGSNDLGQPFKFTLNQNYPNPFNPTTAIGYQLSAVSDVELDIYNTLGQKVVTLVSEIQTVGNYQVEWDARGYSSGVYFYKLRTKEGVLIKKMMLLQ